MPFTIDSTSGGDFVEMFAVLSPFAPELLFMFTWTHMDLHGFIWTTWIIFFPSFFLPF